VRTVIAATTSPVSIAMIFAPSPHEHATRSAALCGSSERCECESCWWCGCTAHRQRVLWRSAHRLTATGPPV
jgi:hypothetical protein